MPTSTRRASTIPVGGLAAPRVGEETPLKRSQPTHDTKQALDRLPVPEQNEILKSIARQIKEAALSATDRFKSLSVHEQSA
jgi:hypothetical protein